MSCRIFSLTAQISRAFSVDCVISSTVPTTIASSLILNRKLDFSKMFLGGSGRRFYNRKKTIKIPPTKPLVFNFGDIVKTLPPIDLTQPKDEYAEVSELQETDEITKKLFSIEFGDGQDVLTARLHDIMKKIQEHPADVKSLEVNIARQTIFIRNLMRHCFEFRKDKRNKVRLIQMMLFRQNRLNKLLKIDNEKYEWLKGELQIDHKPPPEPVPWPTRLSKRATRKKAARDHFLAIKKAKMEEFRQKLAKERKVFDEEKATELEKIEEELKALGAYDVSSLEQTFQALKLGEPFVKPKKPYTTCRRERLKAKFELYAHRRKESLEGTQAERQTF